MNLAEKYKELTGKDAIYYDGIGDALSSDYIDWLEQCAVKLFAIPVVINWVAVKDEVPPERIPIIIWGKGTIYEESVYTKKHGFAGRFDYDVTHWTLMPSPPCL